MGEYDLMVKGEVDVAGGGRMMMVAVGLVAEIRRWRGDEEETCVGDGWMIPGVLQGSDW